MAISGFWLVGSIEILYSEEVAQVYSAKNHSKKIAEFIGKHMDRASFYQKETLIPGFYEFCKSFQITFFTGCIRMAAPAYWANKIG